ncbi:cytochrome P450 [Ganoderma sinense ZZ0214-1]|uniref:Cytochrome P450 n=1 Tax=Ganoderma sinense ZZ0214-1 TaxID=1077348 RepID=A0A2G8SJW9_9APHY|nr:cytochrome P450 [Ganoderma sinense ZZ0214-1]
MSLQLVAGFVAVSVIWIVIRSFARKGIKHLRGPPSPSFLFGHEAALFLQEDAGSLDFQWMKEYGSTWRTRGAFGTDVLMTVDPKAIQHVFQKSGYNYTKKASQNFMTEIMTGPGIISALGEDHQRHRKIMHPAFSAPQLRAFLPLFQRIADKLSEKWKGELVGSGEIELAVNKMLSRATLDVIGEAAFDYDYNALDDGERSAISKGYDNLFKDIDYNPPKAVILFRAAWDYLPVSMLKWIKYMPTRQFRRLLNLNNLFREYGKRILSEQGPSIDVERKTNSKDMMSLLIKANSSADAKTRLDDEELIAEMYSLTLAGHETTSATLSFVLYELARHPQYQERMRQEIRDARARVIARGGNAFKTEDLDSLTLSTNAIKASGETLRLHPIALGLPRVAVKDDVIPLARPVVSTTGETVTEVPVKAGQVVYASFIGYQRLTEVWGEDADVWNPDRFLHIQTEKQPANVGVFSNLLTFSAGLRACIGWKFSFIEMQAFLGELVETFQFDLPREKIEIQKGVAGVGMVPLVRGKPELGATLPLRISLASQ